MNAAEWLDLEARRPRPPFPTPEVTSPEWRKWLKDYAAWREEKAEAIRTNEIGPKGCMDAGERVQPRCTQRADYIYREPIKRKRRKAA